MNRWPTAWTSPAAGACGAGSGVRGSLPVLGVEREIRDIGAPLRRVVTAIVLNRSGLHQEYADRGPRRGAERPVQAVRCRGRVRHDFGRGDLSRWIGPPQEMVALTALLETKLHLPRTRHGLVARPRLAERLERGAATALTLVSAPAGFGKSTLLAAWLSARTSEASGRRSAAWLSLDPADDDPDLFWSSVLAAVRTAAPGAAPSVAAVLAAPHPPPMRELLTLLLNDLGAIDQDLLLVLDDYQVLTSLEVHQGMAFVLDHLPPRLHLVIASRADPSLPLARMRARGELVELRAADLRFTPDEAAAYLTGVMALPLTAADVATLEGRTEGWIAALQLAALSLEGREDASAFIASFAGDDRYVVDYLVEEVLQGQPARVRDFLLRTSVLERLSGALCDAVTQQGDGGATLEALERANLFLVPLDDRRRWYRYHHLFADVLQARLLAEKPEMVPTLHARASRWFEEHDDAGAAIDHALAAGDIARAADLIEAAAPDLFARRQEMTVRRWLEALPAELFQVRPVLSIGYVGALMSTNDFAGAEARLRDAERWLDGTTAPGPGDPSRSMVIVDDEAFGRLPVEIAMYRAGQALVLGDVAGTMAHARRALDLVAADDHLGRGGPAALLGLAYWTTGDLEAAHHWYADGMAALERAGHRSDVVGGAITLADIRIAQGRLGQALSTYERGLRAATPEAAPVLRGAADMHVGMSELFRERNDLDAALRHLESGKELAEHAGLPQNRYRWRVAMARLRQIDGDLDGALELLDEAERVYTSDFSPQVRPIPALRARLWVAQGRVDEALGWVRERGLSVDDELSYLRGFEHVTVARALLATSTPTSTAQGAGAAVREAARLLERL